MTRSLLGTGSKSCLNFGTLFFLSATALAPPRRCSETLSAGEDAGSALRAVDGVDGEDFWKNPRIDFWFFIFWVLDVERFSAAEGGVAAEGEEAAGVPLAIMGYNV